MMFLFINCIFTSITVSLFLPGDATPMNSKDQSSQTYLISTKNKTFLINVNDENVVENTSTKKEKLDKSGSLTSRNFPSNYPNNLDTEEDISVAAGERIKLQFIDFKIEDHSSCAYDYLMVKDDDGTVLLDKTCGSTLPKDVTSRTNTVIVIFHSDGSVSDSGWRIDWQKLTNSGPMSSDCGVENAPTTNSRIQGGSFAAPNQYPWMVRLSGCGGSLISDRHVLTAFHCIVDIARSGNDWTGEYLKVGVHDQYDPDDFQWAPIKTAVWPEFTDGDYPERGERGEHDIAIVILKEPVSFGKTIRPVCLPATKDLVYDGETCLAMGWGRHTLGDWSHSRLLRKVPLEVEGTMRNKNYFTTFIRRNAANSVMEVCGSDSGGPLVHQDPETRRWTIIGTVWRGSYHCVFGTGEHGESIWNKVTAHLDWIKKVLATTS